MSDKHIAKRIVRAIVRDLEDRGALGDGWSLCDEETQEEIIETWEAIINLELS